MTAKRTKRPAKPRAARPGPPPICFDAAVQTASGQPILRLPDEASKALPSRGQVAVSGTINGHSFETVIEPDGVFGHWIKLDRALQEAADAEPGIGENLTVEVEPTKEWPEPSVPKDLQDALSSAAQDIQDLWQAITPMARWEWVRWVNATKNPKTRARRVEVSLSKLSDGKRRPCCFNLSSCTDPELSKSGKLVVD
ncbi:MAG: YdeI/OmpD-associated family protein [Haliangiales bacterium]